MTTFVLGRFKSDICMCSSLCASFHQLCPIIYDLLPIFALCCHLRCCIKFVPISPIIIRTPVPLSLFFLFPRLVPPLTTLTTTREPILEARNSATLVPHLSIRRPRGSDASWAADHPRNPPKILSLSCSCRSSYPPPALSRRKSTQQEYRVRCVSLSYPSFLGERVCCCHGSSTNGRTPDLPTGARRTAGFFCLPFWDSSLSFPSRAHGVQSHRCLFHFSDAISSVVREPPQNTFLSEYCCHLSQL